MALAETFVVALALAFGAFATIRWLRDRAALRASALAYRCAREREAAFVEGARRLGAAARRGVAEVRAEIDRAIRTLAPGVDSVLIFDEDEDALTCVFATGSRVAYFTGTRIARNDPALLPARALAAGHRLTLADAGVRSFHPADAAAVAVPLPRDDGHASIVQIAAPVALDAAAVESIVTLVDHAGFAYALAQERESDRARAEFDGLTGLLTPRAFRDRLGALLERARFAPLARVALLFIDTDHFKAWNDTYGHASGDALLRALAKTLRCAVVDDDDLVARNGGDEFCVVFVDTEKSRALDRAEALRERIASMDFAALRPLAHAQAVGVTASIGVAAYPADGSTPSELLERADEAMYHSKRTGRNAVSYYGVDGTAVRARAAAAST